MPFTDNSFDIVFQSGTLSCIEVEVGLREISRVLRQSGYFISVDTLGGNPIPTLWHNYKRLRDPRIPHRGSLMLRHTDTVRHYFREVDTTVFDFATLPVASLFRRQEPPQESQLWYLARRACWWVDDLLFKIPPLRIMAFKVVWIASKPYKA